MAQAAKKKTGKSGAQRSKKAAPAQPPRRSYGREIGAVVCLFLGLFTLLGCFGVEGWFIEFFCGALKGLLGWGYYLLPVALLASAGIFGFHKGRPVRLRVVCVMLVPVVLGALLQLLMGGRGPDPELGVFGYISELYDSGRAMESGGAAAGLLGLAMRSAFSAYGAVPILIFIFLILVTVAYNTTIGQLIRRFQERGARRAAEPEPFDADPGLDEIEPPVFPQREQAPQPVSAPPRPEPSAVQDKPRRRRRNVDIPLDDAPAVDVFAQTPAPEKRQAPAAAATEDVEPLSVEDAAKIAGVPVVEAQTVTSAAAPVSKKQAAAEVAAETENISREIEENLAAQGDEYAYPPLSLLKSSPTAVVDGREEAELNRERLGATLQSFGVGARVTDITRGPTVTRYDLELDAGVKLAKITNLAGDIALSLGVTGVRIAPIPDKISTVGIEVPNKIVSTVYLRDIIDSPAFRNAKSKLSFGIGKDIGGSCIVGNISKLPHLLIAGTTGSGKSVCMNSLIISLLYKATPDEVRLIMIDPKMVELGIYNGIPHLYVPVVTDPKKAAGALQWAVVEMLKRYRLFSEVGVRDIAAYNEHQRRTGGQTIPSVVTVIDELADLMLVASKEVEESICRVAQMGRAAGMHLVIATQRPSADVITGLMKANIPSRIAFAVSSSLESRIILDTPGAEKLIGMGDMLYAPLGVGKPMRVQGAFVSDEEREDIIRFIKSGSEAQYSEDILEQIERAAAAKDKPSKSETDAEEDSFGDFDELLPQAAEVIFDTKQASVSMLQRRLKLGYSRAARIVDQLEEIGVVGPFEGSKPRQILMTREQWEAMRSGGASDGQQELDLEPESGGEDDE